MIYTDDFCPDQRKGEVGESRIGGVAFCRDRPAPIAAGCPVPQAIMDMWLPRKNQIAMVEATLGEAIRGKRVLWMIDSESAWGAIVKGY